MPLTKEQAERLLQHSAARKARAAELKKSFAPTVYIPEHDILVRFYTDRDGEYIKTFWRHKFEQLHAQCLGPRECEICEFLKSLPDWDHRWKFASREVSIAYGYIDEYKGPESPYIKLNTPVILMGNYKLGRDFSECLVDLGSREAVRDFFEPSTPYYRVKLHLKDKGKDSSFTPIINKEITIPPLPEEFPPLSQCIYPEGQAPSQETVEKFRAAITESYEEFCRKDTATKSQSDDDKEPSTGPYGEPAKCPSSFGNKLRKLHPVCLACSVDNECLEVTNAAAATN